MASQTPSLRRYPPGYARAGRHRIAHCDSSFSAVGSDASTRVTDGTSNGGPSGPRRSRVNGRARTIIERTGPAVRAALLVYASAEECAQFEAEMRSALAHAAEDLDLSKPQEVLAHWHALVTLDANPCTDEEHELIARMKAGDEPIPTVGILRVSYMGL
jgi:hypothetical protein